MGCVTSKQTVPVTPAVDHSGGFRDNAVGGSGRNLDGNGDDMVAQLENKKRRKKKGNTRSESGLNGSELGESGRTNFTIGGGESLSFRLGNLHRYVEVEQVAAGWPAWLSAVAGEAIYGWLPLKAESFEKLEKIGQGTYSSVFRARDLETGKIVALKKVRFDNFEPESVRFMAREIVILRRLDHPNIMKLDGIITSQLSCSIYLVFEYMEHDISGLLSCPNIKFTESQIKCYMKQLLSGLKHCHSQGIMHRDIKGANLLVNNEGIIKIGDFGLANFCNVAHDKRPLTSKVVTLWYRPPELLLGSTDYEASVDLWSIGCVFAELLLGVPLLQGRTEVEQMHKIFKLCGSPCEDYWKKSKLPHATLFKPQCPYKSCLWETFKDLPKNTVNLIETLLSIEPYKRGSASSALASEYFTTKPYACQPSSLPKYPPTKEIDTKHREHSRRKRHVERNREPETSRRFNSNYPNGMCKLMPEENLPVRTEVRHKINGISLDHDKESDIIIGFEPRVNKMNRGSHEEIPFSGPLQVSGSSGFAWARRRLDDPSSIRSHSRSSSKSRISEPSTLHPREPIFSEKIERISSRGRFDGYPSRDLPIFKKIDLIYQNQEDKVEYSGPLLSQSHQIDELLERHERQIRQAVRSKKLQNGEWTDVDDS
ncbi:unnamed protein product [Lactuca virosa]|uniref:Protein kinase domain-containing protein n=1 Tax=Lactuca virosa TaxID=75947 RepID=A0AAU9MVZ3_9ASTR|nr:unnamed protein product [Lactuca virosa]